MKVFGKYFGKKYTFSNKDFNELIDDYKRLYIHNVNRISNTEKLVKQFNLDKINIDDFILNISEELGKLFELDETKIYNFNKYNRKLLKLSNNLIYSDKKLSKKKETLINLFYNMKRKNYKEIRVKGIFNPKDFAMALYLYTLSEE